MPDYISTKDQSNKLWRYEVDGLKVTVTYGRVGEKMKTSVKTFGSSVERDKFIAKKIREKTNPKKGYVLVDAKKVQEETETARLLGTRYKIKRMDFVNLKGSTLHRVTNYDPKKYVYVEILNSWRKDVTRLLLSKTESFQLGGSVIERDRTITFGHKTPTAGSFVLGVRSVLRRLSEQLVEAIKTVTFAAVGTRKLFDDDDDSPVCATAQTMNLVLAKVDTSSVDAKVVSKFASMGARVLEL